MKLKDAALLTLFILASLLVGWLGSGVTAANIPTWYAALNKPPFNPPNWLFAPVWTFLYISMGIAAFLVWQVKEQPARRRDALVLFAAQLAMNAIWTPLFFGAHLLLAAFGLIAVLWLFILWTAVRFYQLSRPAGLLLLPYLAWVSFASVLNFSLWWLNR